MAIKISRSDYANMFGPTTGDKLRLADTEIYIEVEKDLTTYGEEVKFGGGKVIRDGMGQSQVTRAEGAADTVITNALILDYTGIYKADVALRDGRIAAIGKAGNPDTQPGVDIIIGPGTEIIAGEGKILTAGGFDSHIHFICPQQIDDALHSGVTTMLGGGTGPAHGTLATTCTPGPWHITRMLQAADSLPMNLAFAGKGNASLPAALEEQARTVVRGSRIIRFGYDEQHPFVARNSALTVNLNGHTDSDTNDLYETQYYVLTGGGTGWFSVLPRKEHSVNPTVDQQGQRLVQESWAYPTCNLMVDTESTSTQPLAWSVDPQGGANNVIAQFRGIHALGGLISIEVPEWISRGTGNNDFDLVVSVSARRWVPM